MSPLIVAIYAMPSNGRYLAPASDRSLGASNLSLLRHFNGIVDLDAEIANRAF
jgi:hypothetical protein